MFIMFIVILLINCDQDVNQYQNQNCPVPPLFLCACDKKFTEEGDDFANIDNSN